MCVLLVLFYDYLMNGQRHYSRSTRTRREKKVARQTGRKSLNRNEKKRTMNDKYELDHSLLFISITFFHCFVSCGHSYSPSLFQRIKRSTSIFRNKIFINFFFFLSFYFKFALVFIGKKSQIMSCLFIYCKKKKKNDVISLKKKTLT